MDPVVLATITSAVTLIATEAAKKVGSKAGEELWDRIKGLFGFQADPKSEDLAIKIAERLNNDHELAAEVTRLIQDAEADDRRNEAKSLISKIDAKNVTVINQSNIGTINFS